MKKLKKIVALVMTVAMLAGLFVFAGPVAGAAEPRNLEKHPYNDHDNITAKYEDAIQLFTKMRVLEGRDGNNFAPGGFLNRLEAALIMTRTLISREATSSLGNNSSPFIDVPAGTLGSGAVAYARNRGLISGVGNGRFDPWGTLSKAAWLRMLLSAIEYGQNGEFTGTGWAARVFEAATHPDVDLFGRYPLDQPWLNIIPAHRIRDIPEDGLNDPITREEAMALLYNTVIFTRKVVYDAAANIYTPDQTSAGFAGSNFIFIRDDIALRPYMNQPRDNYGRPHDWTIDWGYRNEWIYRQPVNTPTLRVSYKGAQSGNVISTALQGVIGDLTALTLTDDIRLFTNGYLNVGGYWAHTATASYTSFQGPATSASITGGGTAIAWTSLQPYQVLQTYLQARGNNAAFGPAVTVEVYEYAEALSQNKAIDIVIIAPYLSRLNRKVADDLTTLLLDETSLDFQVYDTLTGRQVFLIPGSVDNFQELYDGAAVGSFHLATPYFRLHPVATPSSAFTFLNIGALQPIRTSAPDGRPESGNTTAITNATSSVLRLNRVEAPGTPVTNTASSFGATTITIGGTSYARALISPTIQSGDTTNNYTFYTDRDGVVIGADYTAPGQASMGGFLWLKGASGSAATGTTFNTMRAWASADVVLGTGRATVIDLQTNANRFWDPTFGASGNWRDLAPSGTLPQYMQGTALAFAATPGFYAYTLQPDGTYRLRSIDSVAELLMLNTPTSIMRETTYVGSGTSVLLPGTPTSVYASPRTILTVVTVNGVQTYTGFASFPRSGELQNATGTTLVKLEPGSGSDRIAAEILFIDVSADTIAPPTMYVYLLENSLSFDPLTGNATADFIADDGKVYPGINILNGAEMDALVTAGNRFYKISDEANDELYVATISGFTAYGGYAPVNYKVVGNTIGLAGERNSTVTTWYRDKAAQMRIIGVPFDAYDDQSPDDRGTNFEVAVNEFELAVAVYAENEIKVVFVLKQDIGRVNLAGIGVSAVPII